MGAFSVPQPENPVPEEIADVLEYSGVGGEWFDTKDVVEYWAARDFLSTSIHVNSGNHGYKRSGFTRVLLQLKWNGILCQQLALGVLTPST